VAACGARLAPVGAAAPETEERDWAAGAAPARAAAAAPETEERDYAAGAAAARAARSWRSNAVGGERRLGAPKWNPWA
jgi:hypothetical protein